MSVDRDIFAPRGIKPDVREARGYLRYDRGDRDTVLRADHRLAEFNTFLSAALKEPGWAMPKHSALPWHGVYRDAPLAQLRPDRAVLMSAPWGHHHAGMRHTRKNCRCGIRSHSAEFMRSLSGRRWQRAMHPLERAAHEAGRHHVDPETGELILPIDRPHLHSDPAKYLLPPGNSAKRIDRNPLTTDWRARGLAVFCLEGALKNDAIVSAGWPSFNVPSVSLWNVVHQDDSLEGGWGNEAGWVNELDEFARRELEGLPVVVVCDSDWSHNPQVARHAFAAALAIGEATGAPTVAAAPPEGERQPSGRRKKLGVDDWLGDSAEFGPPGDFLGLRTRELFESGLDDLQDHLIRRGFQRRVAEGMTRMVGALQGGATDDGLAEVSPTTLERVLGIPQRTIKRYHSRALDEKLYDLERPTRNVGAEAKAPAVVRLPEPLRPAVARPTLEAWLLGNGAGR